MRTVLCTILLCLVCQVKNETQKVSHSVSLSRREVEDLKEALVRSNIGSLIEENRRDLLKDLTGKNEQFSEEYLDEVVSELSSNSQLKIPSVLRAFIALKEFSNGGPSDSQILAELLDKLKKQMISFEELKKLVQILFEAAKKEKEQIKTEKTIAKEIETTTSVPEVSVFEEEIYDGLLEKMKDIVHSNFNKATGNRKTKQPKTSDQPTTKSQQEKSGGVRSVDLYDVHYLNYDIDTLMTRYKNLFRERAYLVQGDVTTREMEPLVWTGHDQLQALRFKMQFDEDGPTSRKPYDGIVSGPEEDLVALLGFQNLKRAKNIEVSAIGDLIYLNIPFEVGPVKVVPKFDLNQPSKMIFTLSGIAMMTLDKNKNMFSRDTTVDSLNLDSFSEDLIKFHPSIDFEARQKLTRKMFKILNDVSIEGFLREVLQDTVKISNIIEPL